MGSFNSDQRLPHKQKRVLKHGDEIFIGQRSGHTPEGGVRLLYLSVQAEKQGEVSFFLLLTSSRCFRRLTREGPSFVGVCFSVMYLIIVRPTMKKNLYFRARY